MIDITAIQKKQRPRPQTVQQAIAASSGRNDLEGFTRFYIEAGISLDDFKDWSPQRITNFFEGIAQVIHARGEP